MDDAVIGTEDHCPLWRCMELPTPDPGRLNRDHVPSIAFVVVPAAQELR
jgi:hypothetical protein